MERFVWGKITERHIVGPYEIVEHIQKHDGHTGFHVYVNSKDTNRNYRTLDEALLGAIAFRNLSNPNVAGPMAEAAAKILLR